MRRLWIYYPPAVAAVALALVIVLGLGPAPDLLDALPWFTLGVFLAALPLLLGRAFRLGYMRARLDYWARAAEARRRGMTVIDFVRSEIDRDIRDTSP
jgi:hypothetical protein